MRNDPVIKGSYFARQDIPIKGELVKQENARLVVTTFVSLLSPETWKAKL